MDGWLTSFSDWFVSLVKSVFVAVFDFVADAFIAVFDLVAGGIVSLLGLLPVPAFLSGSGGLGSLIGGLPPFPLYVVAQLQLGPALAIIGAGVAFNLGRKLATLGQW